MSSYLKTKLISTIITFKISRPMRAVKLKLTAIFDDEKLSKFYKA